MLRQAPFFFLCLATGQVGLAAVVGDRLGSRGDTPQGPYDPATSVYCSNWVDIRSAINCSALPGQWGITLADFLRWNPSQAPDCKGLVIGQSYCVATSREPSTTSDPGSTPTSDLGQDATPTASPSPSTTTPPNGITTPTPLQPGISNDCDKFYFVNKDEGCQAIADKNGISLAQFLSWNPQAGSSCAGLWANAYACVSVIGVDPTPTTTAKPTTTKPGNGVTTPTPTQDGMVGNCKTFHLVGSGETCTTIASLYKTTVANLVKWNPGGGSSCSLWAGYYACVGLI